MMLGKEANITLDEIQEVLRYDANTGEFCWLVPKNSFRGKAKVGSVAGSITDTGYRTIYIKGANYKAHRLAFLYMTGAWPSLYVDHIDGDRLNNRWSNLREANKSENCKNQGLSSRNKSGCKGVWWDKAREKYQAYITADGKRHNLGRFDSLEEARSAYERAAATHHGEFKRLA
jgi:hypothetical protein